MKRCKTNDPATLYSECWEYVVACTMGNCSHLCREDAEDMTSQAFYELLQNGHMALDNWVWTAKMRGRWHYKTQHMRYMPNGTMYDMPDRLAIQPDRFEVFHPIQLLRRKDAKAAFSLMMKGYNRREVADELHRHPIGVTKMMERLRNRCKLYLRIDIEIYQGKKVLNTYERDNENIDKAVDE